MQLGRLLFVVSIISTPCHAANKPEKADRFKGVDCYRPAGDESGLVTCLGTDEKEWNNVVSFQVDLKEERGSVCTIFSGPGANTTPCAPVSCWNYCKKGYLGVSKNCPHCSYLALFSSGSASGLAHQTRFNGPSGLSIYNRVSDEGKSERAAIVADRYNGYMRSLDIESGRSTQIHAALKNAGQMLKMVDVAAAPLGGKWGKENIFFAGVNLSPFDIVRIAPTGDLDSEFAFAQDQTFRVWDTQNPLHPYFEKIKRHVNNNCGSRPCDFENRRSFVKAVALDPRIGCRLAACVRNDDDNLLGIQIFDVCAADDDDDDFDGEYRLPSWGVEFPVVQTHAGFESDGCQAITWKMGSKKIGYAVQDNRLYSFKVSNRRVQQAKALGSFRNENVKIQGIHGLSVMLDEKKVVAAATQSDGFYLCDVVSLDCERMAPNQRKND